MESIIKQAISLIEKDIMSPIYSYVYMFTTENISGVLKNMNVSGKRVLTVSSSGDHIFNMLLNGAVELDCYDINYFTRYYFYFKEAAIRSLSYNEFLDFFFNKRFSFNSKVFDNEVFFNKILPNIKDEKAKTFWHILFKKYKGKKLYNSNFFVKNNYSKNIYMACNAYLSSEDKYNELRKKLNNYNYKFYWVNIFENTSNLSKKKYDVIYLSNILDRLYCKDELQYVKKIKDIITKLKGYLNTNGVLGMCYLYYYFDEYWTISTPRKIINPDFRDKYFNGSCYSYKDFNGVSDPKGRIFKNRDALMLMLKKEE